MGGSPYDNNKSNLNQQYEIDYLLKAIKIIEEKLNEINKKI